MCISSLIKKRSILRNSTEDTFLVRRQILMKYLIINIYKIFQNDRGLKLSVLEHQPEVMVFNKLRVKAKVLRVNDDVTVRYKGGVDM